MNATTTKIFMHKHDLHRCMSCLAGVSMVASKRSSLSVEATTAEKTLDDARRERAESNGQISDFHFTLPAQHR